MNRSEIEHILRSAAAILNEEEFVIVGSQAILGRHPRHLDQARGKQRG